MEKTNSRMTGEVPQVADVSERSIDGAVSDAMLRLQALEGSVLQPKAAEVLRARIGAFEAASTRHTRLTAEFELSRTRLNSAEVLVDAASADMAKVLQTLVIFEEVSEGVVAMPVETTVSPLDLSKPKSSEDLSPATTEAQPAADGYDTDDDGFIPVPGPKGRRTISDFMGRGAVKTSGAVR